MRSQKVKGDNREEIALLTISLKWERAPEKYARSSKDYLSIYWPILQKPLIVYFLNSGFLFSRNAVIPSLAASVQALFGGQSINKSFS